jgi:hypothetical protein
MTERYVDKLRREHRARMRRLWPAKIVIPIRCHDPKDGETVPVVRFIKPLPNNPIEARIVMESSLDFILTMVCIRYNVDPDIVSSRRKGSNKPAIMAARMEYCYLAARDTKESVRAIGDRVKRHRATVMYSVAGYCELHELPIPRPGKWNEYRKRKERYREMRDVTRSVRCPTSEQSAESPPDRCPELGIEFRDAASDSRQ